MIKIILLTIIILLQHTLSFGYELSERNRCDYLKDNCVLYLHKADMDGDANQETVAVSLDRELRTNIHVLRWVNENPVLVGKIDKLDGFITGITIADIDSDNKDEIIISTMLAGDESYIYIYGLEGREIIQEFKSQNFPGIILGLTTGDTDGDKNLEIIAGLAELDEENAEKAIDCIEDIVECLENGKYSEAKRLLSSGMVESPLIRSKIIKLERDKTGFFQETYPIDNGLIYRINAGSNKNSFSGIVVDMVDINYENINKFLKDIGGMVIDEVKKSSGIPSLLFPKKVKAMRSASLKRVKNTISLLKSASLAPISGKFSSPDSQGQPLQLFRPKAILSEYAIWGIKKILNNDKKKMASLAPSASPYYQKFPYYSYDILRTIVSWKESPLFSPEITLPEIPQPLLNSTVKLLTWNGSSYDKKTRQIGIYSASTIVANNKIIVKAIELDSVRLRGYINSFLKNLVRVEKVEQERFVDPYTGKNKEYSSNNMSIKEIPLFTGKWLTGRLKAFSFDETLSPLWTSPNTFGPFNPEMYLHDIDGNSEVIVATGDLNFTKLNTYLKDCNNQWQRYRNLCKIDRKDDLKIFSPQLPQDILSSKIEAYDANTGQIKEMTSNLGVVVSKIDFDNKSDKMFVGAIEVDFDKLNNLFSLWQDIVDGYNEKVEVWRKDKFQPFMDSLSPQIEVFNNWAIQWHNNGCKVDDFGKPVSPSQPEINWLQISDEKPYFGYSTNNSFKSNVHQLFCGRLTAFDLNDYEISWKSGRMKQLSSCLISPNHREVIIGGIDVLPLLWSSKTNSPISNLYLFKEKDLSKVSISGKVRIECRQGLFAIEGAKVAASIEDNCIGTGISRKDGSYEIIDLPAGTYCVTASMPGYKNPSVIVINTDQKSSGINFSLQGNSSLSGKVMSKESDGSLSPLDTVKIEAYLISELYYTSTSTITDNNGEYKITSLIPGTYRINAQKQGFSYVWDNRISVVGETVQDFVLVPLGTIEGCITDEDTGQGIKEALVIAEGSINRSALCDNNGRYTINGVPIGRYKVQSRADGWILAYCENVLVSKGTSSIVNLKLQKTSSLRGKVIFDNKGVSNARVILYRKGGRAKSIFTKTDGSYCFSDLQKSYYRVGVLVPGYAVEVKEIDLGKTETTTINFELTKKNKLHFSFGINRVNNPERIIILVETSEDLEKNELIYTFKQAGNVISQGIQTGFNRRYVLTLTKPDIIKEDFNLEVCGSGTINGFGTKSFEFMPQRTFMIENTFDAIEGKRIRINAPIEEANLTADQDKDPTEIMVEPYALGEGVTKLSLTKSIPVSPSENMISFAYTARFILEGKINESGKALLTLSYNYAKVTNKNIQGIKVCQFIPARNKWEVVSGDLTVDSSNHTVSIEIPVWRDRISQSIVALDQNYETESQFGVFLQLPSIETDKVNILIYPNPFMSNQYATIRYNLPVDVENVRIRIYNIAGELVKELEQLPSTQGTHEVLWNNKSDTPVASGIYIILFEGGKYRQTEKVGLIR